MDTDVSPDVAGTFAEYITIPENALVRKPDELSHQQASTLGVAALTAYEGIHDYYEIRAGDQVLIHGASGGIGTFAIQMAKARGAHVTAVCSSRNDALVRSLGADAVIDYQSVDITQIEGRFDFIFDTVGNHAPSVIKSLLRGSGKLVLASAGNAWGFFRALMTARKDDTIEIIVELKKGADRLKAILSLFEVGKLKPVIDREYPFEAVADAIDYVATKRAKGKVVINF